MPVSLILNEEQLDVFSAAMKGKGVTFNTKGRNHIYLTQENWESIRDAVTALHTKNFNIRTKTIDHMERCYYASQILEKISGLSSSFNTASNNDNATVVAVETPEAPEAPVVEETAPVAEAETNEEHNEVLDEGNPDDGNKSSN